MQATNTTDNQNHWGDYSQGGFSPEFVQQSKDIADSWSISPEQSEALKELSVQLAYDMAPVTGEARAIMYADKAAQRAAEAFKHGKYWEGAGHTAEQYAEMLGAIPIGGMALGAIADVSRFGKGAYRVLSSPQIPMKKFKKITDPELNIREMSLPDAIDMARTERHIIPDTSKGADGQFQGAPKGMNTRMELGQMREDFDALVDSGVAGSDWYLRAREGANKLRPEIKFKPVRPVPKKVYGGDGAYIGSDGKEMEGSFTEGRVNVEDGIKFNVGRPTDSVMENKKAGNKVKVNLFKQKAGWKWVGDPPVDTPTIISVEQGNKHYYTLDSDIGNVDLTKYPNQKSEPRLRPSTRGDLDFGQEVGKINLRGKEHPVYDSIKIEPKNQKQTQRIKEENMIARAKRAEHSGQLAVLSAQADPGPNLGWTIEATNEFAAGNNVFMVRTPEQSQKIIDAHTGVIPPGEHYKNVLGPKTGIYEKGINPDKPHTTTGTNDIWHGRAFGYKMDDGSEWDKGFTPAEHSFLDKETVLAVDRANARKLGGRSDWTAPELQAAAWIATKGRGLFKKNPEKYGHNLQLAMKDAAKTYPDYYPKYTVRQTHEAMPSPEAMETEHLSSLKDASWDEKVDFTEEASWIDPETNKDIMFDEMGMLQDNPGKARGLWEDESNPVEVSNILASLEDSQRGKKVGETSEGLLSIGAAAKGYMDAQAGAAWSKAFERGTTGTKKTSSGSYSIDLDRALTNAEMQNLKTIAKDKHGLDIIDTGEGVVLANFNSTKGETLAETLKSGSSPLKKNINKVFTTEKSGALKEIKFKLKRDPSKEEKKYLTDLRQGLIDGNKYKVQAKGRKITITQIKSPGDEMQKILDESLDKDINSIFPGYKGRLSRVEGDLKMYDWSKPGEGIATRQLMEYVQKNPAVLAKIDNSRKIRKQAGRIANRNIDFAAKNNDTLREDIQLSLRLIENGGFTALFDALKRGAILPAIAGPMIMYGIRQEQGQPEGLLSPGT